MGAGTAYAGAMTGDRTIVPGLLIGLGVALAALPGGAQTRDADRARCLVSSNAETGIAGCTALIDTGGESSADLAMAYTARGWDFANTRRYERAIPDFDAAIKLDPANATAYQGRAWTYHLKGDDAQALPDADKAVALAPAEGFGLTTRAAINAQLGRRDQAIADYRAALKLDLHDDRAQRGLAALGVAP